MLHGLLVVCATALILKLASSGISASIHWIVTLRLMISILDV